MKENSKEKSNLGKIMKRAIIIWILIVIGFGFYWMQKAVFFHPWNDPESREILDDRSDVNNIKIYYNRTTSSSSSASLDFSSEEIILDGWVRFEGSKDEKKPLVIYFGGNAENTSYTIRRWIDNDMFDIFEGYNFMSVDYPGYGLSTGQPSDKTMYEAGEQIYDYARMQDYVDEDKIVIVGYSIGTGIATHVAAYGKTNGLILVAPYDKANTLYNNAINIFYGPARKITRYDFNSSKDAEDVECVPLIIASKGDEVINYNSSLNLANYFKKGAQFLTVENLKHNQFFGDAKVRTAIFNYLNEKSENNF